MRGKTKVSKPSKAAPRRVTPRPTKGAKAPQHAAPRAPQQGLPAARKSAPKSASRGKPKGGSEPAAVAKKSATLRAVHAKTLTGNPFSGLLAGLKSDVDARLEGLLDSKLDAVKVHGREVVEVVSAIRDLCLRGGKRLRPALIVTGYRAASSRGSLDPAVDAGVALELLQAFFLIHDDWMDGDEVRRGGPAVHAILSERFGSREAGARAGILAGDHAQALALEVLARLEIRPERLQAVLSAFTQMQLDAVMGQQLDVLGPEVLSFGKRSRDVDGVARTEATYVLKTGSYTVRGPLRMGALLGGAGPDLLATLDRFSLPVGVAFQLRDDLLGVFGEPEQTGKPLGSDLKTAKRTVLLLTALERANARDGKLLRSVLGNAAATDAEVRAATQVFERSGARAVVEGRIEELVNSARSALAAGRLSPEGRALLEGAADVLTARRT